MQTRPDKSGIQAESVKAIAATAETVIRWGHDQFGAGLCLMASMQDTVLIDISMRVDRAIPVVFLDTGYHFAETLETVQLVQARYGIEIEVVGPFQTPRADIEPGSCCEAKPALLDNALNGRTAWMSGLRRVETSHRAAADLIEIDRRGMTKINPLAQWADRDVDAYLNEHDLIVNPLLDLGYTSIGCQPCTALPESADRRSGRWAGSTRNECGLHL